MASVAGPGTHPVQDTVVDLRTAPGRGAVIASLAALVPILWVPLTLLHPDSAAVLDGRETGVWSTVHLGQLVLAPLVALGVLQLLSPLSGAATWVARIALLAWLALFSAFDAIAGIATGVLADGGLLDAATYLFEEGQVGGGSILGWVAQPLWIVVAVASGLALRANGVGWLAAGALLASSLFSTHAGWVAAIGLLALALGLWFGISRRSVK